MKRVLAGLLAGAFLCITTATSFHRHADAAHDDACAVCAVSVQARSAPSSAPTISAPINSIAFVAEIRVSLTQAPSFAVPARAPPSVA